MEKLKFRTGWDWLARLVRAFFGLRYTTKIGYELNHAGTLISRHKCRWCGEEFTVCPAVPDDHDDQWTGCLSTECESYDPKRDVDKLFDGSPELINRRPALPLNAKNE